jgi:hypothetical protein
MIIKRLRGIHWDELLFRALIYMLGGLIIALLVLLECQQTLFGYGL